MKQFWLEVLLFFGIGLGVLLFAIHLVYVFQYFDILSNPLGFILTCLYVLFWLSIAATISYIKKQDDKRDSKRY